MDGIRSGVRLFQRLAVAAAIAYTAAAASAQSLQARINARLDNDQLKNASVSLHVVEITGKGAVELAGYHAEQALAPASNTKLMTTAAAFEKYGPKAVFKTTLYKVGEDLLIVGGGDPALGDAKLLAEQNLKPTAPFERWAETLKLYSVNSFRDVIMDDRVFDQQFTHPNWPEDQRLAWYQAPIGGLSFNANCLDWIPKLTARGVGIELIPETSYVTVAMKAKRGGEQRVWLWRPADSNQFEMRGTVSGSGNAAESVTIVEPVLWAGSVARDTLAAAGLQTAGKVRRIDAGDDVKGAQLIATATTPLMSVLQRANKQSVNMMAESLCKRLGHDATGKPGSWENGTAAVEAYAQACGVAPAMISMDDGSGLSPKNRIAAKAFTTVLAHVASRADGDEFVATLAVPGEEGTLKKRFKGLAVAGGVHAKTGHISGVSTLSGYIDVRQGGRNRRFAFSILCNKYVGNVNPWQDQVCQDIYDWATKD